MKALVMAGVVSAALLGGLIFIGSPQAAPNPQPDPTFEWATVVNNKDTMPPLAVRNFNSYNQPSVNQNGLVVFRARSRGGPPLGPPTHGIYTRDMRANGPIVRILDKSTPVPNPNNLGTTFVETPSFPRIDMTSSTIATRGNHQPVWKYTPNGETEETRGGTTGIYTNPNRELVTGASKLGVIDNNEIFEGPDTEGYNVFEVPYAANAFTPFEVFPGSPAVTGGDTIVFKGNYTELGTARTGVYFRVLEDEADVKNELKKGGNSPIVLIANNADTLIPGTKTTFGSTSPPSAANGLVVFAGFDNEEDPTLGGLYLAPLQSEPQITPLVSIGKQVPNERGRKTFNGIGEGGAFDGRFVGFWGAWGEESKTMRLYCAKEGNKDRIAFCNQNLVCEGTGETMGDPNSICSDETDPNFGISCYQDKEVPVNQGFFVHDISTDKTWVVAKTGQKFDEFLFWNYSGKTPCTGSGHSEEGAEDDGELARWRSSAFIAVSGRGATFDAAFKARTGEFAEGVYVNAVDGIYLGNWPGPGSEVNILTVIDTTMNGQTLDPEAPAGSTVTELGLERESLRGKWLTVNASMGIEGGSEEDGMAGIYLTELP